MTFLILLWMKLMLVCFSFRWPVDHAPSVSAKPKQVVNLLQSAVWLVCTQALPSSCCCFETLTHSHLTGLWIVDDTMAVFGSLLMLRLLYSSEIFSNLHETTLWCFEKICFRFTKGFKEKHWFFCNISCVGNKKEPKDRTCCIFQKKPVTNEPGLQYYSRCNIRRSITYIIFLDFSPSVMHFNILILTPKTLFIWQFFG